MLSFYKKIFYQTEFQPKLALEQCIVRNFLHALVVIITLVAQYFGGIGVLDELVVMFGITYIVLSAISTILVRRFHNLSKLISIAGVITDTSIICFIMYMGGDKEASLYGLLLFLVIANGLRFGKTHMQFANLVCLAGFLTVISFNDFWQSHVLMSVGNVIWLILIPAHLTNLLTKLEQAVSKAESANTAKTLFIANMSHEIRTPLTSIIGFGRTLLNKKQSAEKTENAIASIIRNGEHLSSIVNDILDISKIEAGKLEVEQREFSIIDVVREVDVLFRHRVESEGLKFIINYRFPLPDKIFSDSLRIKQILINLCSNSLKFTKEGVIAIDVSFTAKTNELIFSVKDTGIGFNKAKEKDIFSNFTQADISTTREYGGTGLGLSISAKLIKMLGGRLWVESELGKGSQFYFTVAAGDISNESLLFGLPEPVHEKMFYETGTVSVSGRILLVDDVVDNRILVSSLLEDMGAEVDVAENGKVALEKVSQNKYDLVLLDLQMPVMGGIETLENMRSRNNTTPVVILTANVIQNEEKESRGLDCQGFLSKPVDELKLQNVVTTYLHVKDRNSHDIDLMRSAEQTDENIIVSKLITGTKADKYSDMAKDFSLQLHDRISAIESAFKVNDLVLLKELLHNLRGLGGNMGYDIVTNISKQIEVSISNNEYDEVGRCILELYKSEIKIAAAFKSEI